jgi:hypothetical protein
MKTPSRIFKSILYPLEMRMLHPIREIAQFMNWAENGQRIAQFVK